MEDALGQGSGDGVSESHLCDNLHCETFDEEGVDDGEEIMVEIVGSDVFVDGISGNEDGDMGCTEIGDMDGHISEKEEIKSETANIFEAMDVSIERVENKIGEIESGSPNSIDEKHFVVVNENKTGDSESGDEKNLVVTEGMNVSSERVEYKIGESESELPESRDEKNCVVVYENKTVINELKDENNLVATEAIDVSSEGFENKIGESESGLPKSRDEEIYFLVDENKTGGSDSRDEKNLVVTEAMYVLSEGAECKIRENELEIPESGGEINTIVVVGARDVEAMYVFSEGGENKKQESDTGFFESSVEKNHVVREETDRSSSEHMQCEEAIVKTQMVISKESIVKDEVDYGKTYIKQQEDVSPLIDDASNQDLSGSDSLISHGTTKESYDGRNVPSDVVLNPNGDGRISSLQHEEAISTQMVISEQKTVKDEAADEKSGGEIFDIDTVKDGDCDKEADEKEGFASENKNLVGKSIDASSSDVRTGIEGCVFDSHVKKFECNHENESEEAVGEEFDVVLDFNDDELDINEQIQQTDGCDNDVSDEDKEFDEEIQSDTKENRPIQPEVEDVVDLGVNIEENDSEKLMRPLECPENAEITNNVENIRLAQNREQEVSNLMPSEVDSVAERTPFDINNVSLPDGGEIDEEKSKSNEENREFHENYNDAMEVDSVLGNEERVKESASSLKLNQSGYFSSPENEGHFAISDLVWGKVRSHPWWPGQIFDPSDASEKAVKYHKKDSYLVAYFGDRTFAWNDSSLLKPFRSHFSQIEKKINSEGFQDAVLSVLEEVSRRVELGLTCSCVPKDIYTRIEAQVVDNTGIHEKSCKRYGVDHSTRACFFEADKLIEYVSELASRVSCGVDRLDLAIAQAQLSAFYRFQGYRPSAIFSSPGDLLETDASSRKRKHVPEESFGKKQKTTDSLMDGYDKRVSVYAAKLSNLTSQTPIKPSFKIGECIRRVASQLTGSTSSGKDEIVIDGSQKMYERPERRSMVLSIESFSVDEMISQLEGVAREPRRRHDFMNVVHTFFMGFRSSVASNRRGRKKQPEQTTGEGFEFDDVSDSYWTDRIVHNCSEEQMLGNHVNGPFQLVMFGSEKPVKSGRKTNSRKRYSDRTDAVELDERVKRGKQETSPAELILNFAERKSVPTEINLNKMFRRFGPLMESETEVDRESGWAKVIFKRGFDAEVARDSSEKFDIFGPVLVSYRIGYEPLISIKVLPLAMPDPLGGDSILMQ